MSDSRDQVGAMRGITHFPTTTAAAVDHNRQPLEAGRNCATHRYDREALPTGQRRAACNQRNAPPTQRAEWVPGRQIPTWFGIAAPSLARNAIIGETPTKAWGIGSSLVMYPALNLVPATVCSEVMAVSRVEWSSIEGSMAPPLAAIPLRHALVRVFRRAQ